MANFFVRVLLLAVSKTLVSWVPFCNLSPHRILCGDKKSSPHRILCGDNILSPHRIMCGNTYLFLLTCFRPITHLLPEVLVGGSLFFLGKWCGFRYMFWQPSSICCHCGKNKWGHWWGYAQGGFEGSMDPWIQGSMDAWIHGCMDPWIPQPPLRTTPPMAPLKKHC